MKKYFIPLLAVTTAMFAYAPIMIANAPFEASMGLVSKIFYFHVPSWIAMFTAIGVCGVASVRYLVTRKPSADRSTFSTAVSVKTGALANAA